MVGREVGEEVGDVVDVAEVVGAELGAVVVVAGPAASEKIAAAMANKWLLRITTQ
jgi:hypothetical protein